MNMITFITISTEQVFLNINQIESFSLTDADEVSTVVTKSGKVYYTHSLVTDLLDSINASVKAVENGI